jgi:hypothetical protein
MSPMKKPLFEFYKQSYAHELERRDRIVERLPLSLTLLGGLFTLLGLLFQESAISPWTPVLTVFWVLWLAAAILTARSSYYFALALTGWSYLVVPTPAASEAYWNTLLLHYKGEKKRRLLASKAFEGYLQRYYIDYASSNAEMNDSRSDLIHRSHYWILIAFMMTSAAYLVQSFDHLQQQSAKLREGRATMLKCDMHEPCG